LITFLFSSLILFSVSSKAAATGCLKNSDGTAIMVTAGDATPFAFAGTTTYNIDACSQEPDEYKIKFFKVALCSAEPYTTGGGTAPDFTSCTDLSNTEKEVTLEPGVDKDLIDGELVLPLGSYKYLVVIIDNHLKIKHQQKYVLASDLTISAITKANPGVVTANSHGFANGDFVNISSVVGMTEVNGETFKVANKATNTFELTDVDGNNVNTSSFTTYSSGGVATSGATIYGNSSGSGQFCWTVAAGITTYTGQTYDSDYATAQGVTPVASGEGTTNARLKCGSSVSGKGFATEIIDHFGEDATFVGFVNYGEIDVATDTGISGIELAGNMLQADNTIATNEVHSRRIAQIYRYATPVVIAENTNSFKLKVTTYSSVSIDMSTDSNASHRIYGAKVGGDPFIIEVETGTQAN
jgi:hypothetical protein